MYNELNKHKNSDKLKWWLTLIAFLLMGVTIGGMLLGYIKPMEQPVKEPVQQEQEASAESGGYNLLIIEDGAASIEEASCPDKICVNHKPVDKKGETLVCLPNKVVVEIQNGEEADVDASTN